MPPKAAKRKTKVPKDDDPRGSPDNQPKKKSRLSAAQFEEQDDDKYHVERSASSHFQNWADWQTKFDEKEKNDKRQFSDAFKRNIEAKQDEFEALFVRSNDELYADVIPNTFWGNRTDKASKEQHEQQLVQESYVEPSPASKSNPQPQATKSRQDHPLFKAGQHILQKCHKLIADHDEANNKAAQGSTRPDLPHEQWTKDIHMVQELLLYGRQHGENIVECIVIPGSTDEGKGHLLTPDREELSETGRIAVNMYRKSAEGVMKGGPTWGEMVRSQAGAFGRALDGLAGF
ncbi:hypothetical protein VP1G_07832 [Cytospora mali]|uniref:Uncharacterized protein n=1 Tax=Cytospora mali TaxID=578113 RepID=A0A194V9T0_CYTMA|nr:hypothetical protein VP1G_07832 [Valsa mali var. pyri (nom. inval.)]